MKTKTRKHDHGGMLKIKLNLVYILTIRKLNKRGGDQRVRDGL